MTARLKTEERFAIAISLLPAVAIVGASFWHAFLTGASADYGYAFMGISLLIAVAMGVYLPFLTTKVSYGKGYDAMYGALAQFVGGTLLMMFFSMFQLRATGWVSPATIISGLVLVIAIVGCFCVALSAKG
jgi:hypothetical protein